MYEAQDSQAEARMGLQQAVEQTGSIHFDAESSNYFLSTFGYDPLNPDDKGLIEILTDISRDGSFLVGEEHGTWYICLRGCLPDQASGHQGLPDGDASENQMLADNGYEGWTYQDLLGPDDNTSIGDYDGERPSFFDGDDESLELLAEERTIH